MTALPGAGVLPPKMEPDVTVIIADRGTANTAEAIACVRRQQGVETEIVLVETGQAKAPSPLGSDTVRPAPEVVGCAGYNEGARRGKGKWLAFLDARDRWAPDHLVTMCRGCTGSGADFGCCAAWIVDEDGLVQGFRSAPGAQELERSFLRGDGMPSPSGLFVRRAFWRAAGGFDDWLDALAALDACIRWSRGGKGWSSTAPTVAVRAPSSRSREELRAMTSEFRELRRRYGADAEALGERFGDGELAAYLARQHIRAGEFLRASLWTLRSTRRRSAGFLRSVLALALLGSRSRMARATLNASSDRRLDWETGTPARSAST